VLKKGGALVSGPTDRILGRELLSEAYGTDLRLVDVPGIGLRACLPFELAGTREERT
jgi:ABC-type cobalamin transport system ATPase subunit